MRGSPLIQALFLLLSLILLGGAGVLFLKMGDERATLQSGESIKMRSSADKKTQTSADAEIEITFSSLPESYSLKRLEGEKKREVSLLKSGEKIENPSYYDVSIPSHHLVTYWLDVRWKKAPDKESFHFVKITISPTNGEAKSFAFFGSDAVLNETFDYENAKSMNEEKGEGKDE